MSIVYMDKYGRLLSNWRIRYWYKLIDAVVTAPLSPSQTKQQLLKTTLARRPSNYKKVAAAFCLLQMVAPKAANWLYNACYQPQQMPFTNKLTLLGYGFGSTVFRFCMGDELKVIKIYRMSLGKKPSELLSIVKAYREKHATTTRWYNVGEFELVAPCDFFIIQGHIRKVRAAAAVQPYVLNQKIDLLQDFNDDEIIDLLEKNPLLLQQFQFFVQQTAAMVEQGICFDFLGRENITLVKNRQDQLSIAIVDYGWFNLAELALIKPDRVDRLYQGLERLLKLSNRLTV